MNFSFALYLQLFFASYLTIFSLIVSTFRNNTTTTESVLGSIARGLSTDRVCEVGTRVILSVQILLNFAIALLCKDFTFSGHGFPLQWLYSF